MKLIPLSEYVLQRVDKVTALQLANDVVAYTKFLRQPLTLSMFVPVDDEGEVLNYDEIRVSVQEGTETWDIWTNAKEKVLFRGFTYEGFEYEDSICKYYWGQVNIYRFSNGNTEFYGRDDSQEDRPTYRLKTVEDLVNLHDITLTPSALKLIGAKE